MVARSVRQLPERGDAAEELAGEDRVALDLDPLGLGQPAGLVEAQVGDPELADVV